LNDDEQVDGKPLFIAEIPSHISGFPTRTEQESGSYKRITYRWKSLFRDFGLHIEHRNGSDRVLRMVSDPAPPIPTEEVASGNDANSGSDNAEMGSGAAMESVDAGGEGQGGPGGGPGGGRPALDFAQLDTNADGELQVVELPERMQPAFARIDADGSGGITKEEFDARPRRGGAGGGGDGAGDDRRQRPPLETGDATDAPAP
jgi:hypothetical protein